MKYQPSSANEGEAFFRAFCCRCGKWDDDYGCSIHLDSMLDINDPNYPTELVIVDGIGICTDWQEVCYV